MSEPLVILQLKLTARRRATATATGVVSTGGVTLRYYPGCGRYVWYDHEGEISKTEATNRLITQKKIDQK